jgi:hypothetical protein
MINKDCFAAGSSHGRGEREAGERRAFHARATERVASESEA